MAYYTLKIVITAFLIVAISEIAKRSTLIGAILASIPLVSVLAHSLVIYRHQGYRKNRESINQHILAGITLADIVYLLAIVTKAGYTLLLGSLDRHRIDDSGLLDDGDSVKLFWY